VDGNCDRDREIKQTHSQHLLWYRGWVTRKFSSTPYSRFEDERLLEYNAITTMMIVAVRTSETTVYWNETTRGYVPEGCHCLTRHRENLKSHIQLVHLHRVPQLFSTPGTANFTSGPDFYRTALILSFLHEMKWTLQTAESPENSTYCGIFNIFYYNFM
jgi:hypothetical protein